MSPALDASIWAWMDSPGRTARVAALSAADEDKDSENNKYVAVLIFIN